MHVGASKAYRLIDWLVDWSTDWLIDYIIHLSFGWLIDWLVYILISREFVSFFLTGFPTFLFQDQRVIQLAELERVHREQEEQRRKDEERQREIDKDNEFRAMLS